MVVLAHLQPGLGCHTFRVGRHHHRAPLHEGQGLTHALTDTAPTDLTVSAAYGQEGILQTAAPPPVVETGESEDVRGDSCQTPFAIVMAQAFAELRYGVVVHTRENSVKYGHKLGQRNPLARTSCVVLVACVCRRVCRTCVVEPCVSCIIGCICRVPCVCCVDSCPGRAKKCHQASRFFIWFLYAPVYRKYKVRRHQPTYGFIIGE